MVVANICGAAAGTGVACPGWSCPQTEAELVERIRSGDREAAVQFTQRYEDLVRRRVRGKMGVLPEMRRLFDSAEVFSSIGRRLDGYVRRGLVQSRTVEGVLSLLRRIADRTVVDKQRQFLRTVDSGADVRTVEQIAGSGAEPAGAGSHAPDELVEKILRRLRSETDRQIFSLRLAGAEHDVIAGCTGLSPAAVRKRFQSIRRVVRQVQDEDSGNAGPAT